MKDIQQLLSKLEGVKARNGKFMVLCPVMRVGIYGQYDLSLHPEIKTTI